MLYQNIRPKTFDDIIGNEAVIESLKSMLKRGSESRPHTILLSGPSGCGKTTLARIVSEHLGCTHPIEINAANTNGIDTVRDITDMAQSGTLLTTTRVFILDESHQLTRAAQEGLLKIIEDCPLNVYFIFCTTERNNLIKTVLNRCTEFTVRLLSEKQIKDLVLNVCSKVGIKLDEDVVDGIAYASGGCARQAVVLLDKIKDIDDVDAIVDILTVGTEVDENIFNIASMLCAKPEIRLKRWRLILDEVNKIQSDSEMIRKSLQGLIAKRLMETDDVEAAKDYSELLQKLKQSTYYGNKNDLITMITNIIFN